MMSPMKGCILAAVAAGLFALSAVPAQAQCRGRGSQMNGLGSAGLQTGFGPQAQPSAFQTPFAAQAQMAAWQTQQLQALVQLNALQQQYVLQAQLLAMQQPGLQSQVFGQQAN